MFDPRSDDYFADPYAVYRHYRESDPVHRGPDGWYLFRYADVAAALKDERLLHDRSSLLPPIQMPPLSVFRYADKFLNALDPPTHTRLRSLVSGAFTPRVVESLGPYAQEEADRLLAAAGSSFDLIADFAGPLPLRVIGRLLGIPIADYEQFRQWSHDFSALAEDSSPELFVRASAATDGLAPLVLEALRAGRSELLRNLRDGDLSEDEAVATCMLLLVAGHETTVNLIGNGMLALLQQPSELALLRDDPSLVKDALEEFLRYDAPGRIAVRWASADLPWGASRGERVALVVGSANRDPAQFVEPERLDVRRKPRHLSFGLGIHFCLGAPLARLEGEVAFQALLRRPLQLAGSPVWLRRVSFRGLETFPVTA